MRSDRIAMMTKITLAVSLFVCVFGVNTLSAQQPTREEKRRNATKETPRTIQGESEKGKAPKATAISWQKLSDKQIARMLFPEKKLYFQPTLKERPMLQDLASLSEDEVAVHEVKRLVANFDNDSQDEMAVLVRYSTGMCTFCVNNVVIAVLGQQKGKAKIAWRTVDDDAFDNDGSANISTIKLIKTDKFFALAYIYHRTPGGVSSSKEMNIMRWDGEKFSKIWKYELESRDTGGHEAVPHDSLARVDFLDDEKGFKRIKVVAIYATRPYAEEWIQYVLYEEFAWSEKDQRYWSISEHEVRYENSQECISIKQEGRKDYKQCSKIEPHR